MNGKFGATYDELASVSANVSNLAEEYGVCIDDIYGIIDELGNDWKGADNLAYVNTANSYKEDMKNLAVVVNEYADFLGDSANEIRRTQEEIANLAGKAGN